MEKYPPVGILKIIIKINFKKSDRQVQICIPTSEGEIFNQPHNLIKQSRNPRGLETLPTEDHKSKLSLPVSQQSSAHVN